MGNLNIPSLAKITTGNDLGVDVGEDTPRRFRVHRAFPLSIDGITIDAGLYFVDGDCSMYIYDKCDNDYMFWIDMEPLSRRVMWTEILYGIGTILDNHNS